MISKQIQRYKNVSNRANILKKNFRSFATYRFHYQSNLKSATPFPKCYLQKRNGLLIRKTAIKSSRPFHCAYHPLTP